jgi:hypothetical protein
MEIQVADERILLFKDQLTADAAQKKAWEKKISSFGAISSVTGFFSKPNEDDFELTYQEHRYQPFWHVSAKAKYVYDRTAQYQIPVSAPEVHAFTFEQKKFEAANGHIHMSVMEHCAQEEHDEVFVDGVTGKNKPELAQYLKLSPKEVSGDLNTIIPKDSIIVPPQSRVSAIMRDALAKMIKGIQADTILEERVEVTCVDLYYHPMFAFQYLWKSKKKEAIVEVDGLTGAVSTGNRTFNEYLGKVLDPNFLFDVGADAAGMLIPGGSIAVKVAKKYIDSKKK